MLRGRQLQRWSHEYVSIVCRARVGTLVGRGGCESAPPPLAPSQTTFTPPPVPTTVAVRVDGRVVDLDGDAPVAGAAVTNGGPIATADENGAFVLTMDVRPGLRKLLLGVSRDGYEPSKGYVHVSPDTIATVVLRVYQTLTVRPGESIGAGMSALANAYNDCYFLQDDYSCRRIVVESLPGESIEVELVPVDGQDNVGLVAAMQQPAFVSYERRVTVSGGEVWIIGGPGKVTLTARRR